MSAVKGEVRAMAPSKPFINNPSKDCGGENNPSTPLRGPWRPDEIKGLSGSARRSSTPEKLD